jgi:hypothetical protein
MPSLEESPLQVLEVDTLVSGPGHLSHAHSFRKTGFHFCGMRAINVSNVQACCRPAFAPPAESGRQGLRNPDTSRAICPVTRMAGDIRIWRTNGFDCCFL